MRTGPDRKVVFALLAIAALCVIGLGASLYRRKAAELSRLGKELVDKRAKLASLHDKLAAQPELEEKYDRLQARLAVLEPGLPDSAYIPTFLRQIEGLAVSTHNHIIMIRPQEVSEAKGKAVAINDETGEVSSGKSSGADKAEGRSASRSQREQDKPKVPYGKTDIEVKVRGTYWSLIDFLNALQNFPKMVAVNDVALTPERAGGAKGEGYSAEITATMALTAVIAEEG